MGREVLRVPLDFDWPLDKTWQGYLMGEELQGAQCPDCSSGYTWAAMWVQKTFYRLSMLAADVGEQVRGRPLHPWLAADPMAPYDDRGEPLSRNGAWVTYPVPRPGQDMVQFVAALSGEPESSVVDRFGSSTVAWRVQVRLNELLGLPEDWGICPTCDGHGSVEKYPGQRADAEAWERTDPPTGDGWQLWETVSEGSPISPVFATADGLIDWMTTPAAKWGAVGPWTREQAAAFVNGPGWAPTGIATASTGWVDGVSAVSLNIGGAE